jgi:hypothetical protein
MPVEQQIGDRPDLLEPAGQKVAVERLEAGYWGIVLVWAGLIFGAQSRDILPEIGQADAWTWIFLGAGLLALLVAVWRTSSDQPNPTTWDWIWAIALSVLGVGGFTTSVLVWPVILVLVGLVVLVRTMRTA